MDLARWSRRLEWALAAAVAVLHAAIFLWPERSGQPNFLVSTAHDAQLYSAIVLILAWAVLGPGWVWVRGGALPILLLAWYLPWNWRMFPRETVDSFQIVIGIAAVVLVVIVRGCGQRVAKCAGRERGAQFSLLALLATTTLIAAVVGLLEWLRPTLAEAADANLFVTTLRGIDGATWRSPQNIRQMVMATAVAIAALGAIWAVLRPGAAWLRLAALAITVAVFGVYQAHLSDASSERFTEVAINLAVGLASVAALAGVTVLPLRLMDYRLQRPAKVAPQRAEAAVGSSASPAAATERSRFLKRVAAMLGLFILIAGGIPLIDFWWHAPAQTALFPPSKAFARWMNPRRRLVIIRGGPMNVTVWEVETVKVLAPSIVEEGVIYEDRVEVSSP